MYHYRAVAGVKIGFVPDTFIQVLGGKNLSRMLHHQKKHLVFDIGKLFFLSVYIDLVEFLIDPDSGKLQIFLGFFLLLFRLSPVHLIPAQQGLHPSKQFRVGKGLDSRLLLP